MKTRRHVYSILFVLIIAGALLGTVIVQGRKPKLGLDLQGGLSVTLTAPPDTRPEILDKTITVLRKRIDAFGTLEPEISREGENNVLIQLAGKTGDSEKLLELLGKTAQLQFRQVQATISPNDPAYASATVTETDDPKVEVIREDKGKTRFRLGPAELTGADVRRGTAVLDTGSVGGAWTVSLSFDKAGGAKWQAFTGRLACQQGPTRQIAVVLDDVVESSPQVGEDVKCDEGISGSQPTQITGNFKEAEAKDLALVLTAGALPVKLERSEVRIVSPTLGSDSLRAGLIAGALGLVLVFLYVLLFYRTLGLQTWIGLVVFSAIIYGLVVMFGATIGWNLTLAGIAGLIVSVGIATDSYIVFFERVKEEVHLGRSLPSSIDRGFKHAWRTMATANLVTILAAVVLYLLAVGSVRGFALALGMATTLDLFVTYALTWPLAALLARNRFFAENRLLGMRRALEGGSKQGSVLRKIYRSEFNIDFIGKRRLWFTISGVLVIAAALAITPQVRGLTYGIDFKGGNVFRVPFEKSLTVHQVDEALAKIGVNNAVVQVATDRVNANKQLQVQTEALETVKVDAISAKLRELTGATEVAREEVGQKWGGQITKKALQGLVVFLVLVILYMSWRLEPKMAAAGMIALAHDVLITIGIYAAVGFEVSPATVVATLTILGYSLYDTVVVFDKIRENVASPANARKTFGQIANESTNQVLMRSINTSLTVLLPVGSLLFVGSALLGAETLKDLALALFVGIAAGTYSSIFTATPLLSVFKEREPRYAMVQAKLAREASLRPALAGEGSTGTVGTATGVGNGVEETFRPTDHPTGSDVRVQRRKQSRAKRKKGGR
ncbi:MAG: protein translocase subunit SecF [Actinomycetota bacterium]